MHLFRRKQTAVFFDTQDLRDDEIILELEQTYNGNANLFSPISAYETVPYYSFLIRSAKYGMEMGYCDLRLGHTDSLYLAGNIGYRVYEPYRGHHYAAKACRLLFRQAAKHNMGYVIITCNPDNLPSRRTLEGLGGELLETVPLPEDNDMYLRGDREKCIFRFPIDPALCPDGCAVPLNPKKHHWFNRMER